MNKQTEGMQLNQNRFEKKQGQRLKKKEKEIELDFEEEIDLQIWEIGGFKTLISYRWRT